MPHAIAWRGHNPHQASPEHLVQSYPSLNAHTVGYGPFWENGIPEHLQNAPVDSGLSRRVPFRSRANTGGSRPSKVLDGYLSAYPKLILY